MLIATANLYTHIVTKKAEDVETAESQNSSGFFKWRDSTLSQLDINYRWSPVVYDIRGTKGRDADDMKARAYQGYPGEDVRAGDRAPNAPGLVDETDKETALFEIFKPYFHTLLVFKPADTGVENIVSAVRALTKSGVVRTVILGREEVPKEVLGASAYRDTQGYAHKAYHVDDAELAVVVVRPDGYVGAFVKDAEGLRKYFANIFVEL